MSSPSPAFASGGRQREGFFRAVRSASEATTTGCCSAGRSLDTFNPYKPAVIDWPALDAEAQERLVALPIWDIAVQTEGRARLNVASYAAEVSDPLLRRAIELNAFEEGRHKYVLSNLVQAYGIELAPEPQYPAAARPGMGVHGDRIQRMHRQLLRIRPVRSRQALGILSGDLVDTFEPVIQEEARHILFFVNWAAWHRRTMPFWRRPIFEIKVLAVWIYLVWERIGIARDVGGGPRTTTSR